MNTRTYAAVVMTPSPVVPPTIRQIINEFVRVTAQHNIPGTDEHFATLVTVSIMAAKKYCSFSDLSHKAEKKAMRTILVSAFTAVLQSQTPLPMWYSEFLRYMRATIMAYIHLSQNTRETQKSS